MMKLKILIGGSPCTHWSIAKKNRETQAEGLGWELFKNFSIAKEKFKPDYFLYENNKSASQAIKEQIAKELDVGTDPEVRFTYINSNLVSAQNRQRFYVTNFGDIEQPGDKGILLRDIIDGWTDREKGRTVLSSIGRTTTREYFDKSQGTMVFEPVLYQYPRGKNEGGFKSEKSPTVTASYWEQNVKVVEPVNPLKSGKAQSEYSQDGEPTMAQSRTDSKIYPVYKVENGLITIKGNQYPTHLPDWYYIIRKLTVKECARLQTMPDDYCKAVSSTRAYKCLGNGWTAEVIIHLLNHALKDIPKDTELEVLSMYDGIATGRYCLDKMGFTNVTYHAYETDEYPIKVALDNYPDIIYHGNAFKVREEDWNLKGA